MALQCSKVWGKINPQKRKDIVLIPYFPDYKPRLFFKNFRVAAYVQTFPKNHALHTARCGVPRSAFNHDQLTRSAPQSLTVSAAVWPPLSRPPSLCLSLPVYAWCFIPMAVNCTAVRGGRLLHAPAERGKNPAWCPVLSVVSDIAIFVLKRDVKLQLTNSRAQRGLMCHAGHWPTHVTQLTHFVEHTPDVLAWHQITASPQTFVHAIKPACRVFWTCRLHLDAILPIFGSHVCIRGRSYVHGNNRRGCD